MSKAKWTFMVFMAGDNSLSTAGDNDLCEMRRVGSTADVNVVVEFDNAGDRGSNRYRVRLHGIDEPSQSLGETDSGSPEVLDRFIAWAAETYPADRYALVLWSHGCAWEPTELDRIAREVKSPQYNAREATQRSASSMGKTLFRTTWERVFRLPSPAERAICVDDGSGHSLDTIELGRVLARAKQALGQPIDLLGMDACLMSNLEVAYQARPYVGILVASEESEPSNGWPYDVVLRKLVAQPDLPAEDLAQHIVKSYVESYVDAGYTPSVTQSALDLACIDTLTGPLDAMADRLASDMDKFKTEIRDAQLASARFFCNTLWDIGHLSQELDGCTQDEDLRREIGRVQAALGPGPGQFVLAEAHHGPKVDDCMGVSIYLPLVTDVSQFYAELDFAKQHRWAEMLKAYHTPLRPPAGGRIHP